MENKEKNRLKQSGGCGGADKVVKKIYTKSFMAKLDHLRYDKLKNEDIKEAIENYRGIDLTEEQKRQDREIDFLCPKIIKKMKLNIKFKKNTKTKNDYKNVELTEEQNERLEKLRCDLETLRKNIPFKKIPAHKLNIGGYIDAYIRTEKNKIRKNCEIEKNRILNENNFISEKKYNDIEKETKNRVKRFKKYNELVYKALINDLRESLKKLKYKIKRRENRLSLLTPNIIEIRKVEFLEKLLQEVDDRTSKNFIKKI